MIVQPLDGQALIPVIDKAYAMNPPIPVINLALKIDDKNSVSLESDPILEGRLIGDYAAKKLPQGAKVAILEGEPGNLAAASREKGILEGLKARPDIKVIADLTSHWRRDNAMSITEDWLQAYPQIDAILCHNDDSALGAIEALKAVGKAGKVMVLGVDGLAGITEGHREWLDDWNRRSAGRRPGKDDPRGGGKTAERRKGGASHPDSRRTGHQGQ